MCNIKETVNEHLVQSPESSFFLCSLNKWHTALIFPFNYVDVQMRFKNIYGLNTVTIQRLSCTSLSEIVEMYLLTRSEEIMIKYVFLTRCRTFRLM